MKSRCIAKIDPVSLTFAIVSVVLAVGALIYAVVVTRGETATTFDLAFSNNCICETRTFYADKGALNWKLENTGSTSILCNVEYKCKESGPFRQIYHGTVSGNAQTGWSFVEKNKRCTDRFFRVSETSGYLTETVKPAKLYVKVD